VKSRDGAALAGADPAYAWSFEEVTGMAVQHSTLDAEFGDLRGILC
jgi:hypothetical protein